MATGVTVAAAATNVRIRLAVIALAGCFASEVLASHIAPAWRLSNLLQSGANAMHWSMARFTYYGVRILVLNDAWRLTRSLINVISAPIAGFIRGLFGALNLEEYENLFYICTTAYVVSYYAASRIK